MMSHKVREGGWCFCDISLGLESLPEGVRKSPNLNEVIYVEKGEVNVT